MSRAFLKNNHFVISVGCQNFVESMLSSSACLLQQSELTRVIAQFPCAFLSESCMNVVDSFQNHDVLACLRQSYS